ncbi:MAG: hypothetical protein VX470_07870, partial [Planctomycetota bacterium]|nr:hypothetical protein [Planctomycetota bacterium]
SPISAISEGGGQPSAGNEKPTNRVHGISLSKYKLWNSKVPASYPMAGGLVLLKINAVRRLNLPQAPSDYQSVDGIQVGS